jgi:predicted lactoylglutathione lyase
MEPKKIWENLTVLDVERTRTFYTALDFAFSDPDGHK